jgi:hypothetical protein
MCDLLWEACLMHVPQAKAHIGLRATVPWDRSLVSFVDYIETKENWGGQRAEKSETDCDKRRVDHEYKWVNKLLSVLVLGK